MLGFQHFEHGLIEKYTVLMGSFLSKITIQRQTQDGSANLSLIEVPTLLATKERMLARLQADPNIDRKYSELLPRITWEHTGLRYDGERKLNTTNRRVKKIDNDKNNLQYTYNPVPYDMSFKVTVYGKNQSDVNKIVEQIITFFTPDWTVSLELIPELGISHDIPTILDMASIEDLYSENFMERRVYTWDLEFTMKAYFYGPTHVKPVIKIVNQNIYVYGSSTETSSLIEDIISTPGLDANGNPTTIANNAIPVANVAIDNNWGIVTIYNTNNTIKGV